MKRTILLSSFLLVIGSAFLFTCGVDPISIPKGTGAPHAFVLDSIVENPALPDTSFFSKCDTAHTGDSLTFLGAVIPMDTRVKGIRWDFADGNKDSQPIVKHTYDKGGRYIVLFSINDSLGHILSDTVVVYVNTPPDSVSILSPPNGASNQPLLPKLEWKGYDRDYFDSALVYTLIIFRENAPADTVMHWYDTTDLIVNRGFKDGEKVSWVVLAKDRFGEVVASDTFSFSTIGYDDATLAWLQPSLGRLVPVFSPNDTIYYDTVEYATSEMMFKAISQQKHALVSINQTAMGPTDSIASVSLSDGTTSIAVGVTAPDEITKKTYSIYVTRLADPNTLLRSLGVSSGKLVPNTTPIADSLWDTVSYSTTTITLTPFAGDSLTAIVIGSESVKSGDSCAPISLSIGKTKIVIKATSADGKTRKTYILTIIRPANSDSSLDTVFLSKGTLTQQSAPVPDTLRDTVSFLDSSLILTPVPADSQASITINATAIKSNTASHPIPLTVGINRIIIKVIAPDGVSSKTYVLLVIRKPDSSALLTDPPSGVAAQGISASSIRILWEDLFNANFYTIQRSSSLAGIVKKIGVSNSNSYIDTGLDPGSTWYYRVNASNSLGSTDFSVAVDATTFKKPFFNNHPQSQTIIEGSKAIFVVTAGGIPAPGYQWQKNKMNVISATTVACTTGVLSLLDNNSRYRCIIRNDVASDTSFEAVLTVDSLFTKPFIVNQPHDTVVVVNSRLSFTFKDTGSYITVQWRKNGADLPPATSDTLKFNSVQTTDAGIYSIKLRNRLDSVISAPFRLGVLPKAPSGFAAQGRSALSIGLSWNQAEAALWYRILRGSGTGSFASIYTTSQLSFVDTPLTEGSSYIYRIRGGNDDGESDMSEPISIFTVTFDGQSATTPASPTSKKVISPATAIDALPTPPSRTGYTFGGWFTQPNGAGTAFTASSAVTSGITAYAKWNTYGYTVTFNGQGAETAANPTSKTVISPATSIGALPTVPSKTGYIFGGWFTQPSGAGTAFTASSAVTADITVYARWNTYAYTVTFDDEAATTSPSPTSKTVSLPATTIDALPTTPLKTGYTFGGWFTERNGAGTEFTASSVVSATITVYAKWNTYTYTVTFDDQSATTPVNPTSTTVSSPKTTIDALPTPPNKTGYFFGGWFTEPNGAGATFSASSPVTANITIYAKWNSYSYTVTFDGQSATVPASPSIMMVTSPKTTVDALPISPTKSGYTFGGWFTQPLGAGVAFSSSSPITADITIYASWNSYSYSVIFDGQGATNPPNQIVSSPAITINTLPTSPSKSGYTFGGWFTQPNGAGAAFTSSSTVTADITVYAKWNSYSYTVTFNGQGGTVSPTDLTIVSPDTTVGPLHTMPTPTRSSFAFGGWYTSIGGTTQFTATTVVTGNITVYAKWTATYTITFNKNDGGATGTMGVQTIASGSSASLTANTFSKAGWTFAGWATTSGSAVVYANGASYTMGTANVTLYAKWTANNYSVIFDKNDAGASGTMTAQTIASGSMANLKANAFMKTGWTFAGWATSSGGTVVYANQANYTMGTANATLFAKWTKNSYSVNFDKNDAGASGTMTAQTIAYGASANLTANVFTKTGWTFAGWSTSPGGAVEYTDAALFMMGAANVTLYAKWTIKQYSVIYNGNGNTGGTEPATTNHDYNATVTVSSSGTLTNTGYDFAGWNSLPGGGGTDYAAGTTFIIGAANVTLYAKWTIKQYSVIYNGNGNTGGTEPATTNHDYNATVTVSSSGTLTNTGYDFTGWNSLPGGGGTDYAAGTTFIIGAANVTLYAKWTIKQYSVIYNGNGNTGGTEPATTNHDYNATVTVSSSGTLTNTGYDFAGWNSLPGGGGTDYAAGATFIIGAANVTLYAKWTIKQYSVIYNGNGNTGGTEPATTNHDYNATVTVSSSGTLTNTGYDFAGWNSLPGGGGTDYAAGTTFIIGAANVTLYAKWTIKQYSVIYNGNGNTGGTEPATTNHDYNATVTVSSSGTLTNTGYDFAGWNSLPGGGGTDYAAGTTFIIGAANVTLYAKWTIKQYSVIYNGNGNTGGTEPATTNHDYNTTVTVSSSGTLTNTGYDFAGWNSLPGGGGTDYAAGTTFIIGAANVTLYAKWTIKQYSVIYNGNGNTSGTEPATTSHDYNTTVTVSSSGTLTNTGYDFAGWNSLPGGGGTDYAAGTTFIIGAANVTLYAKWSIKQYSVIYNGNGNTSGTEPVTTTHDYNTAVIVSGNTGILTKTDYSFAGWNTKADGTGDDFAEWGTFNISAENVTLYARWDFIPSTP